MDEKSKKNLMKIAKIAAFGILVLIIGIVVTANEISPTRNFPGLGILVTNVLMGSAILYSVRK